MCHEYTNEELANILDNLGGLFAWKRRRTLVEAAEIVRTNAPPWRYLHAPELSADESFVYSADASAAAKEQPA